MSSSILEKEFSMETFLIEKLTHIRERPILVIEELEEIKVSLKNTKMENRAISAIDKEISKLQKYQPDKELKYSEGLSKGALKQINSFLNLKDDDFTSFSNTAGDNLEPIMQNYVKSHGRLCQILDTFSDETRFIQKLFMNLSTKGINNRNFLFDPKLIYFGVSCKKYKNTFIVNIIFSNSVEDLSKFNHDDELADKINEIRTKENSAFEHFTADYRKILDSVPSFNADQIEKFFTLLNKRKKLPFLKKEAVLDEIAGQLLHHCSEKDDIILGNHRDGVYIPDQEQLEFICNRFISRFMECESFIVQGEPNNIYELLEKVLFTGRKHKEGNDNLDIIMVNDRFQNIGVCYEERPDPVNKGSTIAAVAFLFMDEFSHMPKKPYTETIREEFTRLRKDPRGFIKELHDFATKHKFKYDKDLPDVIERIRLSLRNLDSMPELVLDENLANAANEYITFIKNEKATHFYEEEEYQLQARMRHYLENPKNVCEIVNYAPFTPAEMICSLLIKEFTKDPNKPNHSNILNRSFRFFGVAEKYVREKSLVCVILAENNKPKMIHDKRFRDDLIQDLNDIRRFPKIFMKFVKLPKDQKYDPFKKITKASSEEMQLLGFLETTRGFAEMIEEDHLTEACRKYVFDRINEHEDAVNTDDKISGVLNKLTTDKEIKLNVENKDFLTKFVKPYGSGFNSIFNVCLNNTEDLSNMIINDFGQEKRGNLDSKEFIIRIVMNKVFRENLFSIKSKFFGICAHQERKLVFAIFTNDFICERAVFDYAKTYQGKAPRPDLTEDEIDLIRKDFMRFDGHQVDLIFPELICKIYEENNLVGQNFIYYSALYKFIGDYPEAAKQGIDMNKFVGIVRDYMALFTSKEWVTTFNILKEKARNNLELVQFQRLLDEVHFKFNEDEAEELFRNVCLPDQTLSQRTFCNVMTTMGNNAERIKRNKEYTGALSPMSAKSPMSTRNSFRKSITILSPK